MVKRRRYAQTARKMLCTALALWFTFLSGVVHRMHTCVHCTHDHRSPRCAACGDEAAGVGHSSTRLAAAPPIAADCRVQAYGGPCAACQYIFCKKTEPVRPTTFRIPTTLRTVRNPLRTVQPPSSPAYPRSLPRAPPLA